jgi:hypothetical protein
MSRRAPLCVLAALASAPWLSAQVYVDPCGPAVFANPSLSQELGPALLGASELAQLELVPAPGANGWLGCATVKRLGAGDFDVVAFTWQGPGSTPVLDAALNALNGPGDEASAALSHDGLALVMDCGVGNAASAIGNHPILATRATASGPFSVVGDLGGSFPAFPGYYDPQLGRCDLDQDGVIDDVVYFSAANGGIEVGKLDRANGAVSQIVVAIPPLPHIAGFQFCHSPAPADDVNGITRGLWFAVHATGTGSDAYWYPGIASSLYPQGNALGLVPYAAFDDATAWNANPAVLRGSTWFARAAGPVYGDPLRIDAFTLTSASIRAAGGGTATHVGQLPFQRWTAPIAAAVNLGYAQFLTPFAPSFFGLAGYGHLCVIPAMAIGVGTANGEFQLSYTLAPGLPRVLVLAQAAALEPVRNELYLSNKAWLELR